MNFGTVPTNWRCPWEERQLLSCTHRGRSCPPWETRQKKHQGHCMPPKCSSGDARLSRVSRPGFFSILGAPTYEWQGICLQRHQPWTDHRPCRVFSDQKESVQRHRPSCLTWKRRRQQNRLCTLQYQPMQLSAFLCNFRRSIRK